MEVQEPFSLNLKDVTQSRALLKHLNTAQADMSRLIITRHFIGLHASHTNLQRGEYFPKQMLSFLSVWLLKVI